ncbi:MAG TPA: class I SAM-dependent methyltransferase [Candidatus Sulfotelmatobacter sp.]|jgi:SAM-dependent methyltransferase
METLDSVNREGRTRLFPSLTNPNWLVLRRRREIFRKRIDGLSPGPLDVLDVGGRFQPYRPLLDGREKSYVSVDLRRSPLVNVIARGEQLPVTSESFDLVICTQVLEYVCEPDVLLAEIRRVLKRGGSLLLSAPAVFPYDSSHDLWRFMPGGLRWLLRSFATVEVEAEGSSITGLFRSANVCVLSIRPAWIAAILRYTMVPFLNLTAVALESVLAPSNDQFSANFSVFAKK